MVLSCVWVSIWDGLVWNLIWNDLWLRHWSSGHHGITTHTIWHMTERWWVMSHWWWKDSLHTILRIHLRILNSRSKILPLHLRLIRPNIRHLLMRIERLLLILIHPINMLLPSLIIHRHIRHHLLARVSILSWYLIPILPHSLSWLRAIKQLLVNFAKVFDYWMLAMIYPLKFMLSDECISL